MNKTNTLLLKILFFLFALNSLSLFLYFTSHSSSSPSSHSKTTLFRRPFGESHKTQHFSKPWPILPSYLPWSQPSNNNNTVPFRSCEAYFGNGFTRRVDPLSSGGGGGWFRCWYSETLRSSICEGGRVRMVPERIQMAKGGEGLMEVIGRREEEELPVFQNGSFQIDGGENAREEKMVVDREFLDQYVPQGEVMMHTMRDLISKIWIVGSKEFTCDEVMAKSLNLFFLFK